MSNATAMTRLVSGSNLELSKNCVMGMTRPTIGNALIIQIPAGDFSEPPYIGGIIPETHSLPQSADRLGRDEWPLWPDGSSLQRFVSARRRPSVIPSTPVRGMRACLGTFSNRGVP